MDPSSDYHFLNQILWRRVKLTLVRGIFEGVLQHVDPNKIVVLKKVKNVETGRSVPGVKMFFGHEILNVELLDEVEQGGEKASSVSPNTERTSMDKMKDEDLNVCEPPSPAPEVPTTSLLNDFKYSPSEEEEVTYTVIDQFQQKFGAAMLHIKKQSVLSVAAEGANVCRHGKLCWLQVATNSRVYLFDIFLLGSRAFNNGLQMVLEDKRILKVIHDCRWLSDCLSHQYGILLNNVFDTQVADVLQFSMETGGFLPNCISTLQESLIRHLKVAPKYLFFLEERQKLIQENPEVWFTRPLSPSLLKILALEATYLLPLRLVLLDEMMSDLTTLVDGYLNTYREGSADRLGGTEPTCMELPEELLQLKDFQKQRRERAAKEYRMNAQGLLETRVSPSDTLHPFRKAVLSTLPPCPALEKTDSWIDPSSNLP
ncbi:piRNA biogenesis protein EXD1 isoform X4 [Rousettus aegyptiacus]|uniref:piRNA biogenesis protein EXD1 isoform X4 n=1 Tax=Rousettus aegyptiacus TaxID=9407 RepID=UPI00168D37FA|nr:piRNA biogenesis protein EXD1 isoform X4 [Rousettus aegyptiacus]